jgi:hypothetical protein
MDCDLGVLDMLKHAGKMLASSYGRVSTFEVWLVHALKLSAAAPTVAVVRTKLHQVAATPARDVVAVGFKVVECCYTIRGHD